MKIDKLDTINLIWLRAGRWLVTQIFCTVEPGHSISERKLSLRMVKKLRMFCSYVNYGISWCCINLKTIDSRFLCIVILQSRIESWINIGLPDHLLGGCKIMYQMAPESKIVLTRWSVDDNITCDWASVRVEDNSVVILHARTWVFEPANLKKSFSEGILAYVFDSCNI